MRIRSLKPVDEFKPEQLQSSIDRGLATVGLTEDQQINPLDDHQNADEDHRIENWSKHA